MEVLMLIAVGIVQIIKQVGFADRIVPFIALVVGVGLSFLNPETATISQTILNGLVIGLGSMGLWSGTKAVLGK